ncbi:rhodanese-like domain-containing protein [Pedobacter alpinus]|uniref:Rhodanese-like domain-containing protein n=1 Tax=Pedobacter alpinus TaxID=1590643 RepID=A0ABW5TX13_9SPHI
MKKYFFILISFLALIASSNNVKQNNSNLNTQDFEAKIKTLPNAPIIDVRTPDEFSNGHLQNAINIDWNGNNFQSQISNFDKASPIFVYCLSGGRSASAAEAMRNEGFKEVYELDGGLIKWPAAISAKTNK